MELVFAYGSNMDPAQMRERCPASDLTWFVARAVSRRLVFPRLSKRRGGGVGSIEEDPASSVWGVVFAITQRDLLRLDGFEGVPKAYRRVQLGVINEEGSPIVTWTYVAIPDASPVRYYDPHRDYLALYIRGADYFQLPRDYVDSLRAIRTHT